ncbi:MAG: putative toxin-antitoxin system toxin component, PIN family [Deltaproteobacteria bacterium]|nr:putative toxin-antitoxin system toxin component, PIN family [Deltaproteobacteria bacterium]
MIRVVLDTNVFVSAILTPEGPPAKILEMAIAGNMRLVISPAILREIGQVFQHPKIQKLLKKRGITTQEVEKVVLKILKTSFLTPGQLSLEGSSRDPADDMVISCAVEGEANFIISGDRDLTDLESFQEIRILVPAAFLKVFGEAG